MKIYLLKNKNGTKELGASITFEKNLETGNYESVLSTSKGTVIRQGESIDEHVEKHGSLISHPITENNDIV